MTASTEGGTDFLVTLANAGIACPPTGVPLLEIRAFGRWHWGTAKLDAFGLYMFDVETVIRRLIDDGPVFVLCHAGHGTNSYGLNLVTCAGPVAVPMQHHYIGVYADPVRNLIDINSTYSRLNVLLEAATKVAKPLRWLMLWSNFREVHGVVDLDDVRRGKDWREALAPAESEGELFRSVAENFPDAFFDLSRIRW